ncbi:hypothetical protein C5B42_02880 [Candidatus Cerribacteria bacterium 'Amazon FNV 2010 28 9']|uniref:Uncharacterized protein n=1 Tax=Candidatus Cerribacteria bacterium 'Amazon FNV 2010 28 9' TaxID=2081795 RepID=A0A317JQ49_9BACT|nr:MAG: hypothetical protein C5B42_02880 [Candidatus Cerribacteria bacterium 'Amazon FNV 2010 28 9']
MPEYASGSLREFIVQLVEVDDLKEKSHRFVQQLQSLEGFVNFHADLGEDFISGTAKDWGNYKETVEEILDGIAESEGGWEFVQQEIAKTHEAHLQKIAHESRSLIDFWEKVKNDVDKSQLFRPRPRK